MTPAIALATGGLALAASATAARAAAARWERTTRRAIAALDAQLDATSVAQPATTRNAPHVGEAPDPSDLLPPPIARYLARAVPAGAPRVRRATLRQVGRIALVGNRWAPFAAHQHVAVRDPGFVWDASIQVAPLASVRVRDAYLAGEGSMCASVAGVIPFLDRHGTPAMAEASLLRWLAELVWVPTALRPGAVGAVGDALRWSPVDARTARAELWDESVHVSLDVEVGDDDTVERVRALRHREAGGALVLTLWEGRFARWEWVDGLLVPREGTVGWVLDGRWTPYWRGRVEHVAYLREPDRFE